MKAASPAWLFGGYDGREIGDRDCGGVGVVEMVCGVRMGVGVGVKNRIESVVSSGRNVTVAHGGVVAGSPMGFLESSGKPPIPSPIQAFISFHAPPYTLIYKRFNHLNYHFLPGQPTKRHC